MDVEMQGGHEKQKIGDNRTVPVNEESSTREEPVTEQNVVVEKRMNKPPIVLFWQLIPFLRRFFLYFALISLNNFTVVKLPILLQAIIKCLPLTTLTVFVFRQYNSLRELFRNRYGLFIFSGHIMGIVGSIIILFDENIEALFIVGKAFHLASLMLYTVAFGFVPFGSRLFVRSVIFACLSYYYVYVAGLNQLGVEYQIGAGFFIAAVFILQWRAWARITFQDLRNGRWYEFLGGVGGSFLVISEAITVVNEAVRPRGTPRKSYGAEYAADVFLYLGNLFIALSVLDGPNVVWPQERAIEKKKLNNLKKTLGKPRSFIKLFTIRTLDWIFS